MAGEKSIDEHSDLNSLLAILKRHEKALFGNGQPGVIEKVAVVESIVIALKGALAEVSATGRRMEISLAKSAEHMRSMDTYSKRIEARFEKLERQTRPIIEWKRDILKKIVWWGGGFAACAIVVWFLVENAGKMLEVLRAIGRQ